VEQPRLFQCSNSSGVFEVHEIPVYNQDDLDSSDNFILDCYTKMYLWLGPESNNLEKKMASECVIQLSHVFAENDKTGARGSDPFNIPLLAIDAGYEPPGFSMWFHGWDFIIAKEKATPDGSNPDNDNVDKSTNFGIRSVYEVVIEFEASGQFFPYSVLKRDYIGKPLPNGGKGIDLAKLEIYLSDEEFVALFKMEREQFYECPEWKKKKIKSQLRLY